MNISVHKAWESVLRPMVQRPKRLQVAALCYRGEGKDREYLLVTSRETKRWIIPKGWPIRGMRSNEAALQEAWEEAGVKAGDASATPIGSFTYQKRQDTGWSFPVETLVYPVAVTKLCEKYPEAKQRTREWVSAEEASTMVDESELQQIFLEQAA